MKRLACVFGRHHWTIHDEHGEVYEMCSRCGKLPRYPRSAEELGTNVADENFDFADQSKPSGPGITSGL